MTEEKYKFSDFKPDRILSNNTNRKTITIVGKFPSLSTENQAIILLEKSAFTEENTAPGGLFTVDTGFKEEFVNVSITEDNTQRPTSYISCSTGYLRQLSVLPKTRPQRHQGQCYLPGH
jgi:Scavenger mRNA decapping enzyme (DcpS) N-terminal